MNRNPTTTLCHAYVVTICALVLSFSPLYSFAQDTLYVDFDAVGVNNGSSWQNAYTSLQSAITQAQYGDEIWVAEGTYYPTASTNRTIAFEIPLGVKLYGSFNGTESSIEERDLIVQSTILSGDIGSSASIDNSQTIVYVARSDMNNLIDGFKIEQGYANTADGTGGLLSRARSGGGIYLDVPPSNEYNQLIVRNSFFTTNEAPDGWGGAIYVNKRCGVVLQSCSLTNNQAGVGGAVGFNGGSFQNDQPDIQNCSFGGNVAEAGGGAVYIFGDNTGQKIWVDGSTFLANKAGLTGGAISINEAKSITSIQFGNCNFLNNGPDDGAVVSGGAFFYHPEFITSSENKNVDFVNCTFKNNRGVEGLNISVLDNSAKGINYNFQSCYFLDERYGMMDSLAILGARVQVNDIIPNSKSVVNFKNCIQNEIIQGYQGFSSRYIIAQEVNIINSSYNTDFISTVDNPPAFIKGFFAAKVLKVSNSIFNLDTTKYLNRVFSFSFDTIAVYNSLFNHADCESLIGNDDLVFICDSTNIFGTTPQFADPLNGDFSLPPGSPAVDAGSNAFLTPSDSLDYYGQPRISNGTVDMGAYELQYQPLSFTVDSVQAVGCPGGADGQVYFTLTGIAPFTISWQKEDDTAGVGTTGLTAGQYTFSITDALGQTDSTTLSIEEPPFFFLSFNTSALSCQGASDGIAAVLPTGGTPPYTYLWNTGNTEEELTNLEVGTYTVTVTDQNGCERVASAIMEEPNPIEAAIIPTIPSCFGGSDGQLTAIPTGGMEPYIVEWGNGLISETLSNISAGVYHYTITDVNGCVLTDSTTLLSPFPLSVGLEGISPSCHDSQDGQVLALPVGGTPPYQYNWNNGSQEDTLSMVGFGLYTLELIDANGCEATNSMTLAVPLPLSYSSSTTDVSCWGAADGAISITPNGGQSPYSYDWPTGDTTSVIEGLLADTYHVTIQDANGCVDSLQFVVESPDSLMAGIEAQAATSTNPGDGVAFVSSLSGGTSPYSFLWSNGVTTTFVDELLPGEYSLTITDANNCESVYTVFIDLLQSSSDLSQNVTIPIYPNPTKGELYVHFPLNQQYEIYFYDGNGKEVYRAKGQGMEQYHLSLPVGIYYYRIKLNGFDLQMGKLIFLD